MRCGSLARFQEGRTLERDSADSAGRGAQSPGREDDSAYFVRWGAQSLGREGDRVHFFRRDTRSQEPEGLFNPESDMHEGYPDGNPLGGKGTQAECRCRSARGRLEGTLLRSGLAVRA